MKHKQRKQPTVTDTILRQSEHKKQGEGVLYDFVSALSCAGNSVEYVSGEPGKFVKAYCPTATMVPFAQHICDNQLHDVFHQHMAPSTAKIAFAEILIVAGGLPAITVNVLFSYCDADHNTKP